MEQIASDDTYSLLGEPPTVRLPWMRYALPLTALCTAAIIVFVQFQSPSRVKFSHGHQSICWGADQVAGICPEHTAWRVVAPSAPTQNINLVIAIKHKDTKAIEYILDSVSNPDFFGTTYGKYWTLEQLKSLTYNEEGVNAVLSYLKSFGISDEVISSSINSDFLKVTCTVKQAEDMLQTKFFSIGIKNDESTFSASKAEKLSSLSVTRCSSYSLPSLVARHVDFIGGITSVPLNRFKPNFKALQKLDDGPIIKGYVSPALLNKYYDVPSNIVADKRSTQSVFESLGQSFSPDDLALFQSKFGLEQCPVTTIIGPNKLDACDEDPSSCGEANLDVQYIIAMAQNAPTTFWSMEGTMEPFLDWILDVANTRNPPLVHSISYGATEDDEITFRRFNTELMKLGIRGITVVASSGDDGVGNFLIRQNATACGFHASFPASSPFVVAVGATQGPESNREEIACSSSTNGIVTSGGGFSSLFNQPDYQAKAVSDFFEKSKSEDLPPMEMFNNQGRAYPDVSLLGYNYIIADGNQFAAESGTSASAPVFAAMLTLINGELLSRGLPPVGFANPLLYRLRNSEGVYNDIVKGQNHCGAGEPDNVVCCKFGFSATTGFDPVTGLGSVQFTALRDAIIKSVTTAPEQW